jgi:hypothetical protein
VASLSSVDRQVPFSFEHAWEMTAAEYVRLTTPPLRPSRRGYLRLAAFAVFGIAALFWRYTAGIGVLALVIMAFIAAMPRLMRWAARNSFDKSDHLHGPVAYGVSSRGFWLRGASLGAESDWAGLGGWQEREGWLILSGSGMPPVYLPIGDLREAGVYADVKALAQAHAREPAAPEAAVHPQGAGGRQP